MFFFCLYFYFDNKKLKQKLNTLELETKTILERKLTTNKEDLVSIETISAEPTNQNNSKKELKPIKKAKTESKTNSSLEPVRKVEKKYTARSNKEYQPPKILNPTNPTLNQTTTKTTVVSKTNNKKTKPKPYQKNNTSKIKVTNHVSMSQNFNPNEFIKKDKRAVPEVQENNQGHEYLKEISKQLADELTPQTIELTDYERVQEEEAVISYQELLSLKEKIKVQDEDEDNFIEDLKEFRKLLD